jgi:hypothetical protein
MTIGVQAYLQGYLYDRTGSFLKRAASASLAGAAMAPIRIHGPSALGLKRLTQDDPSGLGAATALFEQQGGTTQSDSIHLPAGGVDQARGEHRFATQSTKAVNDNWLSRLRNLHEIWLSQSAEGNLINRNRTHRRTDKSTFLDRLYGAVLGIH